MSSTREVARAGFEPGRPALAALVVFVLAALTLCWPMLGGGFLLGDDQYIAGYAFRKFGAEALKAGHGIPQWNPYLFGGLPYVAAMHGDIFYPPTLLLRWLFDLDTAFNLGFFLHIVLAGASMYALLRALRTGWGAAVIGGVAYELTGILASQVNPGHDGKLYLSALAPFAFLALLKAIREGKWWGYGLLSLVVGFGLFCHYQMTYYLLVAAGLWTLWLVFADPQRRPDLRWPVALGAALGAVVLGVALSAIQALPFLEYIPHSPRSTEGPSKGWEYATSYAMPVEETLVAILPQFSGILERYWGQNFFKLHTEYLGAVVVLLAAFGVGDRSRGRLRWALLGIAALFALVAWGGHTPFYRLWYEVMPMMKKVRAAGMAWYIPALVTSVFAGFGADRLLRGEVAPRSVLIGAGVLAGVAVLGVAGGLQALAETLAPEQTLARVFENEDELRTGSLRLLAVVLTAGGIAWAVAAGRLRGAAAAFALAAVVVADLWSVDRHFFNYKPAAETLFAPDPIVARLQQAERPYRTLDYSGGYMGGGQGSAILMAYGIPVVLGYHGNELRYYDELLGGKGSWQHLLNPTILDLVAMRYLLLAQPQPVAGFHELVGASPTNAGGTAALYERDSVPQYVRVFAAAAKIPDAQVPPTVINPQFPYDRIVLYSDTAAVEPAPLEPGTLPPPAPVRARLAEWTPGRMRVALEGRADAQTYLMVSENWYPDWRAEVDGKPTPVLRADHTFLSVVLPAGAREVVLRFESAAYARGRLISLLGALVVAALLAAPLWQRARHRAA